MTIKKSMLLYIQVKRNKTKKGGIMNSYYSDTNTIKVQEKVYRQLRGDRGRS